MKHAFFLVGFNNWGKTFTIRKIFAPRNNFGNKGQPYTIPGANIKIYVQHVSNDDIPLNQIISTIRNAIQNNSDNINNNDNILIAFCPTKEPKNQSIDIVRELKNADYKIHFIFLLYKWDGHAKLLVNNILKHFSNLIDDSITIDIEVNQSKEQGKLRAEEVKKYIISKISDES